MLHSVMFIQNTTRRQMEINIQDGKRHRHHHRLQSEGDRHQTEGEVKPRAHTNIIIYSRRKYSHKKLMPSIIGISADNL